MKAKLVILKSEYLELIQSQRNLISGLRKSVIFCAAKLIQYFQHWSNWKEKVHRTKWIYMPLRIIYDSLMGEHSLHVIRAAIELLEKLGIIERRHNPNGQDKTWQYQLKVDVLKRLLGEDLKVGGSLPPHPHSEHGTFRSEQPTFNAEQHIEDQYRNIKATTPAEVVVEEEELNKEEEALITNSSSTPTPTPQQVESAATELEKTDSRTPPTKEELVAVEKELKELRINPDELNQLVQKFWGNVHDAIAYVKEGVKKGWCREPKALLKAALREGRKPEQPTKTCSIPEEVQPPTEEQKAELERAKQEGKIHDYFFSTDGTTKVVLKNYMQLPWWNFLGVNPCPAPS